MPQDAVVILTSGANNSADNDTEADLQSVKPLLEVFPSPANQFWSNDTPNCKAQGFEHRDLCS